MPERTPEQVRQTAPSERERDEAQQASLLLTDCPVCDLPIVDDDRHTRDEDGADVHGACCPDCPC